MARPTKKKDNRKQIIIDAISDGMPRESAAKLAGVSAATLYNWANDDLEFLESIEKADAEAERLHVGNIKKQADKGNVTASIFWLKTRRRGDWSEKQEVEHTGDVNITVKYVKKPIKSDKVE